MAETEMSFKAAQPAIDRRILFIRGVKVMLDRDLAALYGVPTKVLNQGVRRSLGRFPPDFMFELTSEEAAALRSQTVTLERGRGRHSKYAPIAFTEQGVAMLSSVLNSERAVQMNILIIRAFVRLREIIATNREFAARIEKLEAGNRQTSSIIDVLAEEIANIGREIERRKALPQSSKRTIGFRLSDQD